MAFLKFSWLVIEGIAFSLYSGCIQAGWHPMCFTEATLVILAKHGHSY